MADLEEFSTLLLNNTTNFSNFSNLNEDDQQHRLSTALLIHEILYLIVCLISTAADLLIIYILSRYKNMHKPVNMYILCWLISDAGNLLVEPYLFQIVLALSGLSLGSQFLCVFLSATGILRTISVVFILVLLLQWYFINSRFGYVFDKYYKVVIATVWLLFGLVQLVTSSVLCVEYRHYLTSQDIIYAVGVLLVVILLLVAHLLRHCANPFSQSSSLTIALITGYGITWVPVFLVSFICAFVGYSQVALYFDSFSLCLANCYPLVMFYLFYRVDKNFSTCLMRVLKRSRDHDDGTTCFEEMRDDEEAQSVGGGGRIAESLNRVQLSRSNASVVVK